MFIIFYESNFEIFLKEKMAIKEDIDVEPSDESKWKKSDMAKKKTRYYYRSVDDVIEKGKRPGAIRNTGIAR